MRPIDTSKVEIRRVNRTMNGLFAKEDIAAGEVIFVEDIILFENTQRPNPHNIPDAVELALRIWADDHFDNLAQLGFKPDIWTHPLTKEDKKWINKLLSNGGWRGSRNLALDCYKIAAGYNIVFRYYISNHPSPATVTATERKVISRYACMMNHSCNPNSTSFPVTNAEELNQRIVGEVAVEDIKEGDEITFSYLANLPDEMAAEIEDPKKRRAAQPLKNFNAKERRALLKKLYGFNCTCPRCRSEGRA